MALNETASPAARRETAELVFGPAGAGVTNILEWARQSTCLFVRSQVQIAPYSDGATGRIMTAFEALSAFGWPALEQIADKGTAIIVAEGRDAATVLRRRREATGLTQQQVAAKAGIALEVLQAAEEGMKRSPIRVLTRLAQALALDADGIGGTEDGGGDTSLGVRLRDIQQGPGAMSPSVVLGLAEAAWIIATQSRLEEWLDQRRIGVPRTLGFRPEPMRYVYPPPWHDGMMLAHRTRDLLRLGQDAPIRGLKALLEDRLAIPVIQLNLPDRFAGATIANGDHRGVAVNMDGINRNAWVRRMTVAHEIGHLLWDAEDDLNRLRVDDDAILTGNWDDITDNIEKRANAFAAEFLAPQAAAVEVYKGAGEGSAGLSAVMRRFGISAIAASWQIHNGLGARGPRPSVRPLPGTVPTDEWNADEAATADYFVIPNTPIPRRGRFAELCLRSYDAKLISDDTTADYLCTDARTFRDAVTGLRSLFAR